MYRFIGDKVIKYLVDRIYELVIIFIYLILEKMECEHFEY